MAGDVICEISTILAALEALISSMPTLAKGPLVTLSLTTTLDCGHKDGLSRPLRHLIWVMIGGDWHRQRKKWQTTTKRIMTMTLSNQDQFEISKLWLQGSFALLQCFEAIVVLVIHSNPAGMLEKCWYWHPQLLWCSETMYGPNQTMLISAANAWYASIKHISSPW